MNSINVRSDIVMLGTFASWNLGTLQSRALPYARQLQRVGYRVTIITSPWDMSHESGCIDSIDGVLIVNTASASPSFPIQAVQQQLKWINKLNPRIVHVFKPRGFGGLTASRLPKHRAFLLDIDDWEGDGGWNDSKQYGALNRRTFEWQEQSLVQLASEVTAASSLLAVRARKLRHPMPETTTSYLPNGLESSWVRQLGQRNDSKGTKNDVPRILFYSRFAEFSGDWIDIFCRNLARVRPDPIDVFIIGDVPEHLEIADNYGRLNVILSGYARHQDLPALLQSATIAVYPYEDTLITRSKQSVKLLELMAAGRPILASDVGDVRNTIQSAGVVLQSSRPEMFAREVNEMLDQPAFLKRMGARGKERIRKHFVFEQLFPHLLETYQRAGLEEPD